MTANQIEYWKLQEQKRHNLVTEAMDAPLKEAQTKKEYASIDLIQEQTKTQQTQQALNLANVEAAHASAAANYASAALSYERIETENYNQNLLGLQAEHQALRNQEESLSLELQQRQQEGALAIADYNNLISTERKRQVAADPGQVYIQAWARNIAGAFDVSGDNIISNATKLAGTIFKGGK